MEIINCMIAIIPVVDWAWALVMSAILNSFWLKCSVSFARPRTVIRNSGIASCCCMYANKAMSC